MKKFKEYELDGAILNIPLKYDKGSDMYIEDYFEFIDNSVFTPFGHPIKFAGEDACDYAEEETPGGCPDCGSCKFYQRAGEHTWIGICKNIHKQLKPTPRRNQNDI